MKRVRFLRLTAERSSVLDGEETSYCLETATPNPITQPYVTSARPFQFTRFHREDLW